MYERKRVIGENRKVGLERNRLRTNLKPFV